MANISGYPRRIAKAAGLLVICIGLLALAGWVLGFPLLVTVRMGWPSMVPATALTMAAAGLLLILVSRQTLGIDLQTPGNPGGQITAEHRVAEARAGLVVFVGLVRLVFRVAGWNAGFFDHLGLPVPAEFAASGMSPATAADFILLGGALFLAMRKEAFAAFQILAMLAGLLAWLGFSRYFYGGDAVPPFAQMAAHTALACLLLSIGALCARP
ncbi:MAG TPA: hypothetical protein VG733_15910, partial [Chthoniobacteraceae bacterium]|nr:hypothetical protein [Chthoniobacteraceae bacterium]